MVRSPQLKLPANYTFPLMHGLAPRHRFHHCAQRYPVPHFADLFTLQTSPRCSSSSFFGVLCHVAPSGWIVGRTLQTRHRRHCRNGTWPAPLPAGLSHHLYPSSYSPLRRWQRSGAASGRHQPMSARWANLRRGLTPHLCGFFNSTATTIAPKLGAAFIFIAAGVNSLRNLPNPSECLTSFWLSALSQWPPVAFVHLPDVTNE